MTLTESIFWTRIFAKVGAVLLVLLIIIYAGWLVLKPSDTLLPKYLEADNGCGELPALDILPLETVNTSQAQFKIDIESGALPTFPQVVNVYKLNIPGQNFTSRQKATTLAEQLEFNPAAISRPDSTHYQWVNALNGKTLIVDASTLNFELETDLNRISTNPLNLPREEEAPGLAMDVLKQLGLASNDYSEEKNAVYLVKIAQNELVEAESFNTAKLVRVDFTRQRQVLEIESSYLKSSEAGSQLEQIFTKGFETEKNIEGKKVKITDYLTNLYTKTPVIGNIQIYLGGTEINPPDMQVYKIQYIDWKTDDPACGTYQIKSAGEALTELENDQATLVYLAELRGDHIAQTSLPPVTLFNVYKIELVYYDSPQRQKFLQPVYAISGQATLQDGRKAEFTFYLSALKK